MALATKFLLNRLHRYCQTICCMSNYLRTQQRHHHEYFHHSSKKNDGILNAKRKSNNDNTLFLHWTCLIDLIQQRSIVPFITQLKSLYDKRLGLKTVKISIGD